MPLPAEMPIDMSVPGYFIYRDTQLVGETFDPTAPPVFFPPTDSDDLFDALRAKYPGLKTHSERMRDAIIEFLIEERDAEQFVMPSAQTNLDILSPWQGSQSWPSMSNGSTSTFNSPETLALATPTFEPSPGGQLPQLTRQYSTAASMMMASAGTTPPALEQMTSSFSVSSVDQPKQRLRRKMTEAEKQEYRQRRIVKACDKCQKRKRKCNHNQSDVEKLITSSQKQSLARKAPKQTASSHTVVESVQKPQLPHLSIATKHPIAMPTLHEQS